MADAAPWDLFCRVIDNHGDLGVCWRLARALAQQGQPVRLWVDDAAALAWMAPAGVAGVDVVPWTETPPDLAPGAVVIEAFGCDPPPAFVARMAQRQPAPVWINLEYLSAESHAERSHGLPSPQWHGPGRGLTKWFFYPGFTPASGGLIHGPAVAAPTEATLEATPDAAREGTPPTADACAHALGQALRPGERLVSLFCYANPALPGLLQALARQGPALLLAAPGAAQAQLAALALPAGLRWAALPYRPQPAYDALLAGCDLNLVRGEDSFARAQLASGQPFLWQIYPQHDGVHAVKLDAFLSRLLAGAEPALAGAVRASFRAYNGLAPWPADLPGPQAWAALHRRWRASLTAQNDLVSRLNSFVKAKQ